MPNDRSLKLQPTVLCQLSLLNHLQHLTLLVHGGGLREPLSIGALTQLASLKLGGCCSQQLALSVMHLTHLTQLELHDAHDCVTVELLVQVSMMWHIHTSLIAAKRQCYSNRLGSVDCGLKSYPTQCMLWVWWNCWNSSLKSF